MNRRLIAFVLFVVLGFAPIATAQVPSLGTIHEVQEGDTAWYLAQDLLQDPLRWAEIVGANPILREPGRVREGMVRGEWMTIVILKPGEKITIPDGLGDAITPLPISDIVSTKTVEVPVASVEKTLNTFLPWLVPLAIIAAMIFLIRRDWRLRNPIGSGNPIVPGGINLSQADAEQRIGDRFREIGARSYLEANPNVPIGSVSPANFTVVGQVLRGTFHGLANIRYADGREVEKRFTGEPGYRALVRYLDRSEETLYFAEGCANDVRRGTRHTPGVDFRFVASGEEIMVPPVTEPVRREELPRRIAAVDPALPTTVRMTVAGHEYEVPVGSRVELSPNGDVLINVPSSCTITSRSVAPRRVARARATTPSSASA